MTASEQQAVGGGSPAGARRGIWGNGDFVRFWAGEGISLLGSQVTALALPLAALSVLQASAAQVGLLRFVELLPYLVCSLPFGVWADRSRRRPLMMLANGLRALLVAAVPVLALLGWLSMGGLLVVGAVAGVCSVLFDVCWMAYVPSLVRDEGQFVDANQTLGVTQSSTDLAGPAVAGLLVGWLGPVSVLVIDAVSYLVSLGSLATIRTREPRPERPERTDLPRLLASGVRWVFGHPTLRPLAVVAPFTNFSLSCVATLFLLYGVRERGLTPALLGLVFSVSAVGSLLGALVSKRFLARFPTGPLYVAALALLYAAPLLLPLAQGPTWAVVAVFVASLLLCYFGSGLSNVIQLSVRQRVTPTAMMGRMGAAFRTLLFGGGALGALAAGLLAQSLGVRPALIAVTVASALLAVPIACSPLRRLSVVTGPSGAGPA